ncbi:hypothetical protein [Moritella marina]
MKNLNLIQFVCVSLDHTSPMMAVNHAFIACSDRKPGTTFTN